MSEWIDPDGTFIEWTGACPECDRETFVLYRHNGPHIEAVCAFCESHLGFCKQWTDKDWERRVKERDLYRCQRCKKVLQGREAHAHHKIPKWFMPELQFDLNNGICLCTACHKQLHGKGGTIKESEEIK